MDAGQSIQDRYELRTLVGSGGMAEVWAARDGHLGREVAVKFLARRLADDPEFLVRFFAEAQAIARISHPNVVQVLDFGEHDGAPYLVMEFVGGGSVDNLTGDPMPADETVELIAAAARGAGAAHDNGIVHRDLKPGNILLADDGTPKIADFGIAASTRSERLTTTGAAIGSPHYISPEQATGGEATPASDVYALGVVLYELLTGTRPFDADNVTAIAIAHVEQEPRPPSEIADVSGAVEAIVMKALAKDPDERFTSGIDFAVALEGASPSPATERAVAATTVGAAPPPRWWASRAMAGAALALIVLGGVTVAVVARDDPPRDATRERLPEKVGVLGRKTPTPDEAALTLEEEPSPSPTKKEDDGARGGAGGRDDRENVRDDGGDGGGSAGAEPTPEPEPTEEPTPDTNPTPQPSP